MTCLVASPAVSSVTRSTGAASRSVPPRSWKSRTRLRTSAPVPPSGKDTPHFRSIQWISKGWSGQFGNGLSGFQILDASFAVKATVAAPLSDTWVTQGVDLLAAGLAPGATFYFRAIDGNAANSYAWLAVDGIQFTGAAVPEPAPLALLLAGGCLLVWRRSAS